jgi:Zn-dependent protease
MLFLPIPIEAKIYLFVSIIAAISVHEFAHALAADLLGDPTPRSQDRLTLNPLKHLDKSGTLLLALFGLGWGKPVYCDPRKFRGDPLTGLAIVSAAGPASNLLLAYIASLILRLDPGQDIFAYFIYINIRLMLFNLIPLAPLDGYKIAVRLLPHDLAASYSRFAGQPYALLLLFAFEWVSDFSVIKL